MRAVTIFFALLATLAGAYAGFYVMRELGPDDLTGQFGRGDAVIEGNLMQSENFVRVVEALERELGVGPGETTEDGEVTFRTIECAGGCGYAPVVVVDQRYREPTRPEDVPALVKELRAEA